MYPLENVNKMFTGTIRLKLTYKHKAWLLIWTIPVQVWAYISELKTVTVNMKQPGFQIPMPQMLRTASMFTKHFWLIITSGTNSWSTDMVINHFFTSNHK
jgi:hypothetical protein